jgi:hypothetical protein
MQEQQTFEEQQAAAQERADRDEFRRAYRGAGDPDRAYDAAKAVAASDAKDALRGDKVDKDQLAAISGVFNDLVMNASRYRNDDLTDADVDELVRAAVDESGVPPSNRAELKEALTGAVKDVVTTGNLAASRRAARAAAFRVAQKLPRTWSPPSDRLTDDERDAILARVPRA